MTSTIPATNAAPSAHHSPDGVWNVVWNEMHNKITATITFTTTGGEVRARVDAPMGAGEAVAAVDGQKLSWSVMLPPSPFPFAFDVELRGDEVYGVMVTGPGGFGAPAVLDGVRAGSGAEVTAKLGADAIARTLERAGVDFVFAYSGGDSGNLERGFLAPASGLKTLALRNELNTAWASYGYNRVKRRAASAVSVWGVGAMHASPVVYAAKQDSTPLIFFVVEQSTSFDSRDILQDTAELYSALKPLAKSAQRLVNVDDLPVAVRQAILSAGSGKFGPSVLCLTHGVTTGRTTMAIEDLVFPSRPAAGDADIDRVLELLAQAERPVLMVGAGVHLGRAETELRAFAELSNIPVVTSGNGGRGVLPDDHPLYAGDGSMWGGFSAGMGTAQEADLWIAIGYSFSQTATHSWSTKKPAKVVHVDVEGSQIGRIFQPTLGIVADAKNFLAQLTDAFDASTQPDRADDQRLTALREAKEAHFARAAARVDADPIHPIGIGRVMTEELPAETIIVNDEGFIMPGMAFNADKYPEGFAHPVGAHYMSLGCTLPIAIGAKMAAPERTVVSFGGDGGFFYDCGELATLAQHNIKLIVIVNNNGGLYGGNRGHVPGGPFGWEISPFHTFSDSNFAQVAEGFGVPAERVEKFEDFAPALRRALAADGPYLIDLVTAGSSTLSMIELHGGPFPAKFGHGDVTIEGSWPS